MSMPRSERVIVVLVASPSDLELERGRLEDVVREMNLTWSRTLGIRLELVRWETHAYPGVGADPQDVVNQELTDEPDIFIGMMWSRYGTPTGRAGSGTEEEFNRALARHRRDPSCVRIMFYFKDAPVAPSAIDPEQLRLVQEFRASLGVEGALHWKFGSVDEFERLLRLHLARQIQHFGEASRTEPPVAPPADTDGGGMSVDDELGLIDYMDLVDEHFAALNEITGRITFETTQLGQRMDERTAEMNAASAKAQGALSRREVRMLIDKAAGDMNHFVVRMKTEIPLFRSALLNGADAAAKATSLSAATSVEDREKLQEARGAVAGFLESLAGAHRGTTSFRASVLGLPRMTAVLNKAKRDTADVLGGVLEVIEEGQRIVAETVRSFDSLLGGEHDA